MPAKFRNHENNNNNNISFNKEPNKITTTFIENNNNNININNNVGRIINKKAASIMGITSSSITKLEYSNLNNNENGNEDNNNEQHQLQSLVSYFSLNANENKFITKQEDNKNRVVNENLENNQEYNNNINNLNYRSIVQLDVSELLKSPMLNNNSMMIPSTIITTATTTTSIKTANTTLTSITNLDQQQSDEHTLSRNESILYNLSNHLRPSTNFDKNSPSMMSSMPSSNHTTTISNVSCFDGNIHRKTKIPYTEFNSTSHSSPQHLHNQYINININSQQPYNVDNNYQTASSPESSSLKNNNNNNKHNHQSAKNLHHNQNHRSPSQEERCFKIIFCCRGHGTFNISNNNNKQKSESTLSTDIKITVKESEAKRERRAAKTLAIITGKYSDESCKGAKNRMFFIV